MHIYKVLEPDNQEEKFIGINKKEIRGIVVAILKVLRNVLIDNLPQLKKEIIAAKGDILEVEVPTKVPGVESLEVVLRVLHNSLDSAFHSLPIEVVYDIIRLVKDNAIDSRMLNLWYSNWCFKDKVTESAEIDDILILQLLFPSLYFDHAKCFAWLTKWLSRNIGGHIQELPSQYRDLHLEPHIISQSQ